MRRNPVFLHRRKGPVRPGDKDQLPGYYFWDLDNDYQGPFSTQEEAQERATEAWEED